MKKCLSILTTLINYIEQDHYWIDKGNCLLTKYYRRDRLQLVKRGNKKLNNTIIKGIKHSNLTLPMNTKKYKATTGLTKKDLTHLSRHSTKTLNSKLLSIIPPHKNAFSEIACETNDYRCNNTISVTRTLPQIMTIGNAKSKIKQKIKYPSRPVQ